MKKARDCIQPSSRYTITLNPVQGRETKSSLKKKKSESQDHPHSSWLLEAKREEMQSSGEAMMQKKEMENAMQEVRLGWEEKKDWREMF